ERPQLLEELLALLDHGGVAGGVRMHQIQIESAEEEFLGETRFLPFRLPSRLGDLPGLLLGDLTDGTALLAVTGSGHRRPPRTRIGEMTVTLITPCCA